MGRGSNRKTAKMRRRVGWRKKKARIQKRIAAGSAAKGK